ncbi:phage tail protein [Henriciella sp.]|uniref:phage tail protein n=1 Tax=Henriciella sp. TaxID=1968823 RepID=UPI00263320DA|nr:tail fiber protein [Henriciella sp.]
MVRKTLLTAALIGLGAAALAPAAEAGTDAYMGEIVTVGFQFCPRGTMEADGRLLPIDKNAALFSLLGSTYGGDGRTTFALPDLREEANRNDPGDTMAGETIPSYYGVRHCVVTQGIYPSRN